MLTYSKNFSKERQKIMSILIRHDEIPKKTPIIIWNHIFSIQCSESEVEWKSFEIITFMYFWAVAANYEFISNRGAWVEFHKTKRFLKKFQVKVDRRKFSKMRIRSLNEGRALFGSLVFLAREWRLLLRQGRSQRTALTKFKFKFK